MKAKPHERAEARRLRGELGMPVKRIAAELGVSVSSVSVWTRDIAITKEQLRRNVLEGTRARSAAWAGANRRRRAAYQQEGRDYARRGDPLHQAGCLLYWAEGTKSRNLVCFSNSDAHIGAVRPVLPGDVLWH